MRTSLKTNTLRSLLAIGSMALAGLGVALVPRLYVGAELEQGRLVTPWPEGKTIAKNFCLVLPERIELSEGPVRAFATWILDEARGATTG